MQVLPAADPDALKTLSGICQVKQMLLVHGPHLEQKTTVHQDQTDTMLYDLPFSEEFWANHFVNTSFNTYHQDRRIEGKNYSRSLFCPLIQFYPYI